MNPHHLILIKFINISVINNHLVSKLTSPGVNRSHQTLHADGGCHRISCIPKLIFDPTPSFGVILINLLCDVTAWNY